MEGWDSLRLSCWTMAGSNVWGQVQGLFSGELDPQQDFLARVRSEEWGNGKGMLTVEMPLKTSRRGHTSFPFSSLIASSWKKELPWDSKSQRSLGIVLLWHRGRTGLCPDFSHGVMGMDGSRQLSNEVFYVWNNLEGHMEGCDFSMPCGALCWIKSSWECLLDTACTLWHSSAGVLFRQPLPIKHPLTAKPVLRALCISAF